MDLNERDYRFTDDQVKALGFSSYEELEKYYDLEYMNMENQPWTKEQCERELQDSGDEDRLNYSHRDRLKAALKDRIGIITDWNDTNWKPTVDEIFSEREALSRILNVYFNLSEREARLEEAKIGGRK